MQSICGIDVSKDRLDIMVLPEQQCISVHNAAGWAGRPLDLGDRSGVEWRAKAARCKPCLRPACRHARSTRDITSPWYGELQWYMRSEPVHARRSTVCGGGRMSRAASARSESTRSWRRRRIAPVLGIERSQLRSDWHG
jgi:hypothetical protein